MLTIPNVIFMTDVIEKIKKQIEQSPVLLYMKGTPDFPLCGFSGKVSHLLEELKIDFNFVNILDNPDIRTALPSYAQWPTYPQLWVKGELIGGCDIVCELQADGDLEPIFDQAGIQRNSKIKNIG
jgi:monothiol glutaredoxin